MTKDSPWRVNEELLRDTEIKPSKKKNNELRALNYLEVELVNGLYDDHILILWKDSLTRLKAYKWLAYPNTMDCWSKLTTVRGL